MSHSVENLSRLLSQTAEELRRLTDASLTVGQAVSVEGNTLIPLYKAGFGFAGGGTDLKNGFAGGTGGKTDLTPVGVLTVKDGTVRLLPMTGESGGGILELATGALSALLHKNKKDTAAAPDAQEETP